MERVWILEKALDILDADLVEFDSEGPVPAGTQGWSKFCRVRGRALLAINPDTHLPKDLIAFHELGHVVLGHGKLPMFEQREAYAEMEVQAMKVALALGEELLSDSAAEWRQEIEGYIAGFVADRLFTETTNERAKVADAIEVIRAAGLVSELVAA